MATTYPDKEFQEIYDSILATMGDDATLRANIEGALRPLYEQSIAQLQQQRIENNAAIDTDAYSRGMGNSTWVTDAKLRQLKNAEGNMATLSANYNNQLYSALMDAIRDRDDKAYDRALQWWEINKKNKNRSGGSSTPTVTVTEVPGITTITPITTPMPSAAPERLPADPVLAPTPVGGGGQGPGRAIVNWPNYDNVPKKTVRYTK